LRVGWLQDPQTGRRLKRTTATEEDDGDELDRDAIAAPPPFL
jgi:hypothetical protein